MPFLQSFPLLVKVICPILRSRCRHKFCDIKDRASAHSNNTPEHLSPQGIQDPVHHRIRRLAVPVFLP